MAGVVQIAEQHPIAIYLPLGGSAIWSSPKIINTACPEIHRPPFKGTAAFFLPIDKEGRAILGHNGKHTHTMIRVFPTWPGLEQAEPSFSEHKYAGLVRNSDTKFTGD